MTIFKKIIVLTNDQVGNADKASLRSAITLAKASDASIKVVKIIDNLSKLIKIAKPILNRIVDVKKDITNELQQKTASSLSLVERKTSFTCKVLQGISFIEIIKEVIRGDHDILITTMDKDKSAREYSLGSNTFHLLRKCPCPVWVINPFGGINFDRILVAIDLSLEGDVAKQFNKKIMAAALSIASLYGAKIYVFHAWQLVGEKTLRNRLMAKVNKQKIEKLVRDERINCENKMNEFLKQYSSYGNAIVGKLERGDPIKLIPGFINKNNINLLVMGTVSRVDVPGLLIGNTAEEILKKIDCSVVAMKPDGFVSPVR